MKSLHLVVVAISISTILMGCRSQQADNQEQPIESPALESPSVSPITSEPPVTPEPSVTSKPQATSKPQVTSQPSPSPIQDKLKPKPQPKPKPKPKLKPVRIGKKGNCDCPYDTDKAGKECGGRSAYLRKNGRKPRCYTTDPI